MNKVLEECALVKLKSLELSLKLAFNLEILFPENFPDYPRFWPKISTRNQILKIWNRLGKH